MNSPADAEANRRPPETRKPPAGARFARNEMGFEVVVPTRTPWAWVFLGVCFGLACLSTFLWRLALHGEEAGFGRVATGATALAVSGLATVVLGAFALHFFGKVRVSVRGSVGELFIGIGPVGWRRRFSWDRTTSIQEEAISDDATLWYRVVIRADRVLAIGLLLDSQSSDYLLDVLQGMLRQARGERS